MNAAEYKKMIDQGYIERGNEIEINAKVKTEQEYLTCSPRSPLNPRIFQLELSSYCDMSCLMCPRSTAYFTRSPSFMKFSLVKRMYERGDFSGTEALELHGFGESLLNPEFSKICNFLHDNGISCIVSTNGKCLSNRRKMNELLKSKLRYLVIPVDSTRDEVYSLIRNGGNLKELLTSVGIMINKYIKKVFAGERIPTIAFQMIQMEQNLNEVKDFVPLLTDRLIKYVGSIDLGFMIMDGHIVFKTVFLDTVGGKVKTNDPNVIPVTNFSPCIDLWYGVMILSDGTVVPCDRDFNGDFPLGNVNYESLHSIWNGNEMMNIRALNAKDPKFSLCENCQERNLQNLRFIPWLVNDMWNGIKPVQE